MICITLYVLRVCTAYINTSKLLQRRRLVSKPLLWIYYDAEEGRQIMMSIVRTCVIVLLWLRDTEGECSLLSNL